MPGTKRQSLARGGLLLLSLFVATTAASEPPVTALCFSPDGQQLLVASQLGLRVHDPLTLEAQGTIVDRLPPAVHSLRFAPGGDRLLVAGGIAGEVGSVKVLSWPERSQLVSESLGDDVIYGTNWSPAGKQFAVASLDGVALIVDATTGETLCRLTGHSAGVIDVAWVDSQHVMTASRDATLRLWDANSGQLQRTFNNHAGELSGVVRRPPPPKGPTASLPQVVSLGHDRTVRFWQPTIGRLVRFHRFESARPLCAAWLPDGGLLAVGTTAGQVALIDPLSATVRESCDLTGDDEGGVWVTALAIDRDGDTIVAGDSAGHLVRFTLDKTLPSLSQKP